MTSLRTKQLFVLDDNLESPMAEMLSCLFLVSECAFYDGEVNCFGIASPPDVSVYCYQHHGIFSMSWWAPQKTIFYYFLPFPIIPTEKNLCQFRNKFHICHVLSPLFPDKLILFGIHTPPHHNYLNEGKMDVYNDNFVAGGSVCAKLAVCFHGLFQDALLYAWRGSSLHYGKPMSEELFFHFFRKLFFSSPCLLRKSAARIFVNYINRQSFSRKNSRSYILFISKPFRRFSKTPLPLVCFNGHFSENAILMD